MRYGIIAPNLGAYADPRALIQVARTAEDAGWEALFVWDHLAFVWGPPSCDAWVALGAVAASTSRILLGSAVTPVARRRPQVLAHEVATVAALSGGRIVFGAGLGGVAAEFSAFGDTDDAKVRAERLDEGLEVLRRLWSGDRVTHSGPHFSVHDVALAPAPGHVPVWIGGRSAATLRRAARWDGWIADSAAPDSMTMGPEEVAASAAVIRSHRGGAPFEIAVIGYYEPELLDAYAAAGATWWLESIHDLRGPLAEMLAVVEAGPPTHPNPPPAHGG